jgi:hypothetical protein
MPLGNTDNILVGAASLYIAPLGTVPPAKVAGTRYRATVDAASATWTNVGFTQDGFEVSNDPSYGEVEVDQLLDAALIFKDGMSMSLSTTFAEATLENLLVAWGLNASGNLASSASHKKITMKGGTLGEAPYERTLLAVGNAPRLTADRTLYGDRVIHAYRVLSVESSAFGMARADAGTVPVTFRALPDSNGDYGSIVDFTVA